MHALLSAISLAALATTAPPGSGGPATPRPITALAEAVQRGQAGRPAPAIVNVSPSSVSAPGHGTEQTEDPLALALSAAGPGTTIQVQQGDYRSFGIGFRTNASWNARTSGGSPHAPVLVRGIGLVRVLPTGSTGDTLAISQEIPNGWITFENFQFVPGYRAAIMFHRTKSSRVHTGYKFHDCDILGEWNHLANGGTTSKWGVSGTGFADFEFRGVRRRARVENIRYEHGFYLQSPVGDVTIENVDAERLGRTFCQFTARAKEGPPGGGTVTVRNCTIEDVGISRDDGYKGGSAITIGGRITGTVLIEGNTVRAGFQPELRRLTQGGLPYGTGALVCWSGGETVPNGRLVLKDNHFEFAEGCGDRPLVSIAACREVVLAGTNHFDAGHALQAALAIDPPQGRGGRRAGPSIALLRVDAETVAKGLVELNGSESSLEEIAEYAQRLERARESDGAEGRAGGERNEVDPRRRRRRR